eukprot:g8955.t1
MAYEALIVIGFGVSLAVVSVALFVAHVKRINAPNRADPSGIVVHIDLGAALAKDEADLNRKLACRSSAGKVVGGKLGGGAVPGAFALQQDGVGRRRRRPGGADGGGDECREDTATMTKVDAATSSAEDTAQEATTSPSAPYTASMVLPSPLWAEAFVKYAGVKRKQLRGMIKSGEVAAGWEAKWERLPLPRRRMLLQAVREELVHAVSSYVGRDEGLFDAVCPNLGVSALVEDHRGISGLSRLVRGCVDGKLPEPRSKAFLAVQEALARASAEAVPKDGRAPVRAFLPTFRKLCSSSFCIGALEAIVSGRADGTAGPTLGSVCSALVKTGGSGILMYAFFHGLKEMSSSEMVNSSNLPAGGVGRGS